jgi:hypothetical protein
MEGTMHDTTQRRAVSDRDLQAGGQDPATTTQTAYRVQRAVRRNVKALPAQLATERRRAHGLAKRW